MQHNNVRPEQRFNREDRACPICGGWDSEMLRREGSRCYGWLSDDGEIAYCTRRELAGSLQPRGYSGAYLHRLHGHCECGIDHAVTPRAHPLLVTGDNTNTNSSRRKHYRSDEPPGIHECSYIYTDQNGLLLYRVLRFRNPKSFRIQRAEKGKWEWGLGNTKRVLYRLPELLAAPMDAPIFLPEGEKDVDNLIRMGKYATTNAGGVNGWRGEYTRYLRHRSVVIVEDNDDAGRDRTNILVERLSGVVEQLGVCWFPDSPTGYDVTDWLSEGYPIADIPAYPTSAFRLARGADNR